MAANSHFSIAVHALCWIELAARRGERPLTSERIAESLASNPVLVRRLLAPLRGAGIVESGRGPGSGWTITRPTDDIRLSDVRQALAADPLFAMHPHEPKQTCPVGYGIRPVLASVYKDVEAVVDLELSRRTVSDVLGLILAAHPLPEQST
ncbi:Rrf2 family transcriptional regulator [Microbacterium sp. G2-8]|uniref:Rrf2 family transcriptional regulator n=1 Tax=Microbacterium sp. G2-8 TaxID=2842454 RepID=UPI001C8AB369